MVFNRSATRNRSLDQSAMSMHGAQLFSYMRESLLELWYSGDLPAWMMCHAKTSDVHMKCCFDTGILYTFLLADTSFHAWLSAPSSALLASVNATTGSCAHLLKASLNAGLLFVKASAFCCSIGTHPSTRQLCLSAATSISTRFPAKVVLNLWIASQSERASVTGITSYIGVADVAL